MNKHIGSNFDDFLKEENLLDSAEAVAIKRVIAYQVQKALEKRYKQKKYGRTDAHQPFFIKQVA